MVDYSKYTDLNYYPSAAPEEYRPTYFDDEFHNISHVLDKFSQEYYPAKGASTKTSNYTATILDDVILCTGTFTVTLYDVAGKTTGTINQNAGRRITIKNIGTGTITIDGSGAQTIDGALTKVLALQYGLVELISDGVSWWVI